MRRMRLRNQLELQQVRCVSPLLADYHPCTAPVYAAYHPCTVLRPHFFYASYQPCNPAARTHVRWLVITPAGGHRRHNALPQPALPARARIGQWSGWR